MKQSAGLLMYRRSDAGVAVLLVHPGGPFWAKKDAGAWTFPRGEVETGEPLEAAACREFREETGIEPPATRIPLGSVRLKGGKIVHAWAVEGDCDPATVRSNTFTMEWPPKSGKLGEFPEIDRAAWFDLTQAAKKLRPAEAPFLVRLADGLKPEAP